VNTATAAGNESLVNTDRGDVMPPGPRGRATPVGIDTPVRPDFDRWLEELRPRLVRLAVRLLWNIDDAEEIAQEALLCGCQQFGRLRDPAKRNAWLYRITINQAHNRARRRHPWPLPPDESVVALTTGDDPADGPGRLPLRIRQAIAQLPQRQQAALVLREIEGLAYEDIAAILDVRAAAVRLLVHRARESVRETVLRRWPKCLDGTE
jgi:RNA polymerase sigma-70 factor (ECF subfamily)